MTLDKDLYEILGVSKDASDAEIRKAFLKLAKKFHPDMNQGNKAAETKFKEVNFAHEVLKDAKKRKQYDQMRAMGANPYASAGAGGPGGPRPGGPGGFSADAYQDFGLGDLFNEIFGGGFSGGPAGGFPPGGRGAGRGGRGGRSPFGQGGFQSKGADQTASLNVAFLDAVNGGERQIELSDGRRLAVKIPAGVDTGSKIRLAGQGEPGLGGGPPGDLIITLSILAHPYFTRDGDTILLKLPIKFSEAVLGAEIEVPTIDGKVHMRIPRGVSSGQRLKLAGRGIRHKDGTRGDQFVEVQIKIPKENTTYREAAEKLVNDGFDPRAGLY